MLGFLFIILIQVAHTKKGVGPQFIVYFTVCNVMDGQIGTNSQMAE